jgi:hypothetical protein
LCFVVLLSFTTNFLGICYTVGHDHFIWHFRFINIDTTE